MTGPGLLNIFKDVKQCGS